MDDTYTVKIIDKASGKETVLEHIKISHIEAHVNVDAIEAGVGEKKDLPEAEGEND